MKLSIRDSVESDLEIFFHHQTDEEANYMAAFTPKNPNDKEAYLSKWKRLLKDDSINIQSIIVENKVVGCVVKFVMDGDAEITYAISKEYWGQGIATSAVKIFIALETTRPIFGRVAFDNSRSQRILEKVGFERIGNDHFFANARGMEIEEYIFKLS